jgi:hypothetical protein
MRFLYKAKSICPKSSQKTLASQFNFPRSFACLEPSLRNTNSTSFSKFDLLLDIRVGAWAVVWEVYTSKSSRAEVVVALCYKEIMIVSYVVPRAMWTCDSMFSVENYFESYLHSTSVGTGHCHWDCSATAAVGVVARRLRTSGRRS